ncbi:diguanylate cyclase (GGDEF) domain-containing protein [Ruminococcaceae bacterium FB2012]|nr:diguanylate cyclase (GGDEF) domain-containing protein [Ruminococcaceae bacterium FB2012]
MNIFRKLKRNGIPLRITHLLMMFSTLVVMSILLIEIFHSSSIYKRLSDAADNYIEMQNSATQLMTASDYLTDRVQQFAVEQNVQDMNDYLDEVFVTKRREKAIEKMAEIVGDSEELKNLKAAMGRSEDLTEREYYSMRLVCEACGYSDMHEKVAEVKLTAADAALDYEGKIRLAQKKVFDDSYYTQKEGIRRNMESCVDILIARTHQLEVQLSSELDNRMLFVKIFLIIQTVAVIFVLWMTSYLGISPILKGVQKIKENRKLPITGSYEFRYLAKTYNKMYDAFQQSIEHLNYDASHDKLTGLYNRAGYEVLCSGIDIQTTAVMMIDADNFKDINDQFGHATGDKVLKKIADTLRHTFRHEDYICRMGGDEFLVFMLHMDEERRDLIRFKTDLINKRLKDSSDGIPKITVSVGVAFGSNAVSLKEFIDHADEALYRVKNGLKCGCAFY